MPIVLRACSVPRETHEPRSRDLMHWARAILRRHSDAAQAIEDALKSTDPLRGEDSRRLWLERGGQVEPASFVVDVLEDLRKLAS